MTDLEPTRIETIVLAAVIDRPRYGYELVRRIEELTEGRITIRPGNLYRVLHRLEQRGLVSELDPADAVSAGPARRYFTATPAGRRLAASELSMYSRVLRQMQMPSLKKDALDA